MFGWQIPTLNSQTNTNPTFSQADLQVLSGNVQRPNGIFWYESQLYAACNGDWTLYRIDDTTGDTITFVFGIRNIHSMYIEGEDNIFNIWSPDFDTNRLYRTNQGRSAPAVITSDLDGPWGITPLDEENFLITNLTGNNIVQVSKSGNVAEKISGLRSPAGIASDEDFIYFANNGSARRSIEWVSKEDLADEVAEVEPQPLVRGLQNTAGMVLAQDGNLYFTYALGTRGIVGRVNPDECREDGCTSENIDIVVFTELPAPLAGLTISDDMRLFVHTIYRPEIYWVQLPKASLD